MQHKFLRNNRNNNCLYFKKLFHVSLILILSLLTQGCIVAAVGAGVGSVMYAGAKKKEAGSKSMETYNQYLLGMEEINIKRQNAHLKPEPIMTYDEYSKMEKING